MALSRFFTLVFCTALSAAPLCAQGTQRTIGGGCPGRSAPAVTGTLTIGSRLTIDTPGCFTGQGGFGLMLLGSALPTAQWIPISLVTTRGSYQLCDLVLLPTASLDVTNLQFPFTVVIPNDPTLQGQSVTMQSLCTECGFVGCGDLLTQGLELTFA